VITVKELEYISAWARKVPYPGVDYAEHAARKLIESFETYNLFYKDKEYDFILSNGEQFSFEIIQSNLCHMLGVDYRNLSDSYFRGFREDVLKLNGNPRSYELLNALIENIDEVLAYDESKAGRILNYYRIMVKCSIFEKMSDFNKFNFGVINFDKNVYNGLSSSPYRGNAEKFLYVQSNEQACPYFMMGVLPEREKTDTRLIEKDDACELFDNNDANRKFVVETLFAPRNIPDFFNGQSVCIPTQILTTTSTEMIKKEATPSNKIALLNQYKTIISEYGLANNMNIYGDYLATLSSQELESSKVLKK